MNQDSKVRQAHEAAKAALAGQLTDGPYKIVFDDGRLEMTLARVRSVAGKKEIRSVPGLVFSPFELGKALATRDALNRAAMNEVRS